jgi:hypothetical protein
MRPLLKSRLELAVDFAAVVDESQFEACWSPLAILGITALVRLRIGRRVTVAWLLSEVVSDRRDEGT